VNFMLILPRMDRRKLQEGGHFQTDVICQMLVSDVEAAYGSVIRKLSCLAKGHDYLTGTSEPVERLQHQQSSQSVGSFSQHSIGILGFWKLKQT